MFLYFICLYLAGTIKSYYTYVDLWFVYLDLWSDITIFFCVCGKSFFLVLQDSNLHLYGRM